MHIRIEIKVDGELLEVHEKDIAEEPHTFTSFWNFIKKFEQSMKSWSLGHFLNH